MIAALAERYVLQTIEIFTERETCGGGRFCGLWP